MNRLKCDYCIPGNYINSKCKVADEFFLNVMIFLKGLKDLFVVDVLMVFRVFYY